ncbi:unnamed protein product [Camellia sinensis]
MNWFGALVDLNHNAFIGKDLYDRLHSSDQVSNAKTGNLTPKRRILIAIAAAAISTGFLFISIIGYVLTERIEPSVKKLDTNSSASVVGPNDGELLSFSLQSILAATDIFSEAKKLGEGRFGPVYKGNFPELQLAAIKRLSKKSLQGMEEDSKASNILEDRVKAGESISNSTNRYLELGKLAGKAFYTWTDNADPQPGMFSEGTDPEGRPGIFVWKQHDPYWRSSVYDYSLSYVRYKSPEFASYFTFIAEGDEFYLTFSVSENLINIRAMLTPRVQAELLLWEQSNNSWVSCMHCFGDLGDLKGNDINGKDLYVRIHDSDQGGNGKLTHKSRSVIAIAAAAISTGLLLICSFGYALRRRIRSQERVDRSAHELDSNSKALVDDSNNGELLAATDNFSEANKLGEGEYSPVHKEYLPEVQEVAIKKQSKTSLQGTGEFMNELKLITKLQHKKLVWLLGCCVEQEEKILIYEYMCNGSLDNLLFYPSKQANLDWTKRFQIIEGITQGLIYLHEYSRLKVIHRDLKASNILLDEAMNPKILDFGTARSFGINQIEENIRTVVGTCIGVLILEIVSGKRNTILMLSNENASIPSPKELAFSTCRSSNTVNYPSQTFSSYSNNEVTISMLEA